MKNKELIYWICGLCGSKQISDPKQRHNMTYCKCKRSALDAEEFYSRGIGNVIEITKEEYELWEATKK